MSYAPRLKSKYREEIVSSLQNKFEYKSSMQVPRLLKICINQGVGAAVSDKKLIDNAVEEMTLITGQRAVAAKSKKDISNFKLRKNVPIGVRVTLRDNKMYEFLDIDRINKIMGMDITFVTTANTDKEALELLKEFGLPFKNQNNN